MADNNSLLFIPDISGFTEFVNDTEISHSYHIISELLELLIDHNELGMTVSEIEGDAILFYRFEDVPSAEAILAQAKRMFIAFHEHLQQYNLHRICDCGACRTAHHLTLKIVAHAGPIRHLKVKNFEKIYGKDVILIHRLLKNKINDDEYLLITPEAMGNNTILEYEDWVTIKQGSCIYGSIGEVCFDYVLLNPLHDQVKMPQPIAPPEKSKNPVVNEVFIDTDLNELYDFVSNFEHRLSWHTSLKDLKFNRVQLNRQGVEHVCVLNYGNLHFQTVKNTFEEGERAYGEKLQNSPVANDQINYYVLRREGTGTRIRMEGHYSSIKWPFRIMEQWIRRSISKTQEELLQNLKLVAESNK